MSCYIKDELLRTYRNTHKPGLIPLLFGIPFTIGCVGFVVLAIHQLMISEIIGGILFLLVGAPIFALIAYGFGWSMYVDYIKAIGVIKQEKYIKVRARCKSKTIRQDYRYHDSADTEPLGSLIFESETEKYLLEDWHTFNKIEPDVEYLLIFIDSSNKIDVIVNENAKKIVYFK